MTPLTRLLRPLLLVAPLAVVACRGADASPASTASTSPPTSATAPTATRPTTTSSTSTTSTTSTTLQPHDPSRAGIPVGTCDTITEGAIGFRNDTGTLADDYRRIGTSQEGRTIWAEHWGPEDGDQVLVLGQVHGDECAPAWFVRAVRERPPTTFGIWLVPTVNPDGLAAHTRLTADGTDPNRDGFTLTTPEARSVMSFTAEVQPVLTVHVHSPYRWVGAHNGPLATQAATAMSEAAGWGPARNAGRVRNGDQAFLWEGQERVIPGHQSVLVEFPAVSPEESPAPPDPTQKQVATVAAVEAAAVAMRDALYEALSAR